MTTHELAMCREIRDGYGALMSKGYPHEQAVRMLVEAYGDVTEAVLVRAMWLDPSIPDCDPL